MFISILLFVLGTIFISYDVYLITSCPGTFWDNVISFTHIWSALGAYCIFTGIWRIKKGSAFVKAWSKKVRIAVFSLVGAAAIISVVNLCFIMNPVLASENDEVDYVTHEGLHIEVPDNEPQFKPFDKVLVRQSDKDAWRVALYSHFNSEENIHVTAWLNWYQCIPYAGNENLVGTTDKPKEE